MKKVNYRLEALDEDLVQLSHVLGITNENLRPRLKVGHMNGSDFQRHINIFHALIICSEN